MSQKKLMFISHDATRTGAPILLLNLADVFLNNGYKIDFILKNGGPLETEFRKRGKTVMVHHYPLTVAEKLLKKLKRLPLFKSHKIDYNYYDAIVSNTITNGDILQKIRKVFHGPIVSYIHELKMATDYYTTRENLKTLIECTNIFAVPSDAVKYHLIKNITIPSTSIYPLNYYIPVNCVKKKTGNTKKGFVVGALGTTDWRKSPDLFIQTAVILFKHNPELQITFVWQGASSSVIEINRLNYDIEKSGMVNKIKLLDDSSNVDNFFDSIDLFFLTSREDPFPLVVLEAANYSIPTICFDGSGGACEFIVSSNGGHVVPYLQLSEAAKAITAYFNNPEELKQKGNNAKSFMNKFYQNEHLILQQFRSIMDARI